MLEANDGSVVLDEAEKGDGPASGYGRPAKCSFDEFLSDDVGARDGAHLRGFGQDGESPEFRNVESL